MKITSRLFELFPALCWASFLVIPLLGGLVPQVYQAYSLQFQGVGISGFIIVIADLVVWRLGATNRTTKEISEKKEKLFIIISIIAGLLIVLKLRNLVNSPLIHFLYECDSQNIALQREFFETSQNGWTGARLLNFLIPISGVLVFAELVFRKKEVLATTFLMILSGVLCFSTAKAPLFLLLFACLFFLAVQFSGAWLFPPFLLLIILPIFSVGAVLYFQTKIHPLYQKHYAFVPLPQAMSDDAGDQYRRLRKDRWIEQTAATYLAYRLFFVPIGVSSRWYEFAQLPPAEKELSRAGASSLANAIGRWAYTRRFSEEYLPHVRAYASLDADAFCRFAMPGVLLASLGYMATRIVLFLSCGGTTDPLQQGLYSQGLILCSFVPYQGSLQALLGPQGVLLIILLGFFLQWIYCKRNTA